MDRQKHSLAAAAAERASYGRDERYYGLEADYCRRAGAQASGMLGSGPLRQVPLIVSLSTTKLHAASAVRFAQASIASAGGRRGGDMPGGGGGGGQPHGGARSAGA